MKRLGILLPSLVFVCATALAQGSIVRMSVATVNGRPVISVFNGHRLPIEAFLVTVDISGKGGHLTRIYYDVHVSYKHALPVVGGTSRQVPLPHIVGATQPVPTLRAVIFSDGTTWGEKSWVDELLRRRTILADRLQEVMALLQKVSDDKLTKDQGIAFLQHAREERKLAATGATPEEQVVQDLPFYSAIKSIDPPKEVDARDLDIATRIEHVNRFYAAWLADIQGAKPSGAVIAAAK
jgi:hypothetical protein